MDPVNTYIEMFRWEFTGVLGEKYEVIYIAGIERIPSDRSCVDDLDDAL